MSEDCIVCGEQGFHFMEDDEGEFFTFDDFEVGIGVGVYLCIECYQIVMEDGWEAVTGS